MPEKETLIIKGAVICDGTGEEPPFEGDVLIAGDRIKEVKKYPSSGGKYSSFPGKRCIDARGLLLTPGFIDLHSHSDLSLFAAPEAPGLLAQGVTSIVTGNCGLSPFPILTEEVREHLQEIYKRYGEKLGWKSFREYAALLQKREPAVNVTALCGHNTLRANFSTYQKCDSSPAMTLLMKDALEETLQEGALGLSTGLLYVPGKHAAKEELFALMEILKKYNGLYATHLRSEGAFLREALAEALELGNASSRRVLISHLKTAGEANWHFLPVILEMFHKARKEGMELFADRYPYTFSQSSLSLLLPGKYDDMSDKDIMKELLASDGEYLEKLAEAIEEKRKDFERVILTSTGSPFALEKQLLGKSIRECALLTGISPGQLIIRILQEDAPGSMAAFGGMSEENLQKILREEFVSCGTDETARDLSFSLGKSHPRGFGSFPLFAKELAKMAVPLEKIICRLTGLPAKILHWEKRGIIKEGAFADLLLLDWENYKSNASFAAPHTLASGVEKVFINGVEKGSFRNGKILSPNGGILL